MFEYCIDDSGSSSLRQLTLRVGGRMTFDQEDEMQRVFVNSLHVCDHLVVNLDQIVQVDFSFFMLICVTHRTADLLHKRLSVIGSLPIGSTRHFEYVHNSRHSGCHFAPHRSCCIMKFQDIPSPEHAVSPETSLTSFHFKNRLNVEFDYGWSRKTKKMLGFGTSRPVDCC